MSTKDESLLVTLIKRSVGLPTGQSGCCGPSAGSASGGCCGTAADEAEAAESVSTGCCEAESSAEQAKPPSKG